MPSNDQGLLLQPYPLGSLRLKNRVVMSAMTRVRADAAGCVQSFAVDYYRQRAGAGLILSEATNISPQAVGAPATPGIWADRQVESWRRVTAAVHEAGGLIFLQLWHTGRLSHEDLQPQGAAPVAPSALRPVGQAFTPTGMKDYPVPRALRSEEIPAIVQQYGQAAARAKDAGFDGVEIHSANNYLIEQFIRDSSNHRKDEYGGSIENRLRFPLGVAQAVVAAWGPGRVGVKISPTTTYCAELDSDVMATYGTYLDKLDRLGLAYIHCTEGTTFVTRDCAPEIDFVKLRERFRGPYIANNCFQQGDAAEAISRGRADLVSFGRPFIGNPDLVERFRAGATLVNAPKECWYGGDHRGYSDWPALAPT